MTNNSHINNAALCPICNGDKCKQCNATGISSLVDFVNDNKHTGQSRFDLALLWIVSVEYLVSECGYKYPDNI